MKIRNTFRQSLFCKLVSLRLVLLMLQMVCGAGMVHAYPANVPGAPIVQGEDNPEQLVDACGPLCLLIVALVIIGVVSVIIIGLLKLCKMLDKQKKSSGRPDDESGQFAPRSSWSQSGMQPLRNAFRSNWTRTVQLTATEADFAAYDITSTSTNLDGSTNTLFYDRTGTNVYCMRFETSVQSSTNVDDWSNPTEECRVRGWISFAPDFRMAQSRFDPSKTEVVGRPQNILIVCYTNSVAVSRVYYPAMSKGVLSTNTDSAILIPAGDSDRKFFRLSVPTN